MGIKKFLLSLVGGRDSVDPVSEILRGEFESPLARSAYSSEQERSLHYAVARGDLATVQKMIAGDPSMARARGIGMQPLHRAAMDGRVEMAAYLISAGADVNALDEMFGWTPLHYAARNRQLGVLQLLMARGADRKVRDDNGHTPLAVVLDECGADADSQHLVDCMGRDYTAVADILRSDGGA